MGLNMLFALGVVVRLLVDCGLRFIAWFNGVVNV